MKLRYTLVPFLHYWFPWRTWLSCSDCSYGNCLKTLHRVRTSCQHNGKKGCFCITSCYRNNYLSLYMRSNMSYHSFGLLQVYPKTECGVAWATLMQPHFVDISSGTLVLTEAFHLWKPDTLIAAVSTVGEQCKMKEYQMGGCKWTAI